MNYKTVGRAAPRPVRPLCHSPIEGGDPTAVCPRKEDRPIMNNVVRLAIVDPNDASRSALKHLLLGIDTVWLEADCSRYEFFGDIISQTCPDVAVVALDAEPAKALKLVSQISRDAPTCAILCISSRQDGSLILQAMRNGAREFLADAPTLENVLATLDRIQARTAGKDAAGRLRSSRVITVCGAGGGVGCTSLATNLGCVLARADRSSVAVLDLDLTLGDADIWLDLVPDTTIRDIAGKVGRFDSTFLKRSLTRHACGVFLLPGTGQIGPDAALTPDQIARVVVLLKTAFTHQVIDIGRNFGPLDLAILKTSDTILMVTQLDRPCLRNVVRLLELLDRHDGLREKVRVVANRVGLPGTGMTLDAARESIGQEIFWELPDEFAAMVESRNQGVPLVTQSSKSRLTTAIEGLARKIDEPVDPAVAAVGADVASDTVPSRNRSKGLARYLAAGQR